MASGTGEACANLIATKATASHARKLSPGRIGNLSSASVRSPVHCPSCSQSPPTPQPAWHSVLLPSAAHRPSPVRTRDEM